jgi:hypothetical protein
MSIVLEDGAGHSLKVNAWNWGVLHFAVECARPPLFHDEDFMVALRHGGAELDAAQVAALRDFLADVVLPRLAPGERLQHDLSTTSAPDDGTLHRDDLRKNYSLRHDVLVAIIDFLKQASAPVHVR